MTPHYFHCSQPDVSRHHGLTALLQSSAFIFVLLIYSQHYSQKTCVKIWARLLLPERDLALSKPVVCGFSLCRKDVTTGVHVIFRGSLLKLGAVKQGMAYGIGSNRRAWTELPWLTKKSEKTGPWEQGQGVSPGWAAATYSSLVVSLMEYLRI